MTMPHFSSGWQANLPTAFEARLLQAAARTRLGQEACAQDKERVTRFHNNLRGGHVRLDLQPILDCDDTTQVLYHEALLRIDAGSGHAAETTEQIILALERTGMIRLLDHRVLHACIDRLEVQQALRLGCNISGQSAVMDTLWEVVFQRLQANGDLARRLTIEITESARAGQADVFAFVKRLQRLGVQVAVDDFGVGHSNLEFALRCHPDIIKVDRAFLEHGRDGTTRTELLPDLIRMCRSFAPRIVVEGVSDPSDLQRLSEIGGVYGQGYGLGKPQSMSPPLRVSWRVEDAGGVRAG